MNYSLECIIFMFLVKPAPVSDLIGEPLLTNCIKVFWNYETNFQTKIFRVRYYSSKNKEIQVFFRFVSSLDDIIFLYEVSC